MSKCLSALWRDRGRYDDRHPNDANGHSPIDVITNGVLQGQGVRHHLFCPRGNYIEGVLPPSEFVGATLVVARGRACKGQWIVLVLGRAATRAAPTNSE